jgi:hypothetical protein
VTFHANAGETYRIVPGVLTDDPGTPPQGAARPDLLLVGEPTSLKVGPRKKRTTFSVWVINRGDGPTGPIDLIASAPKKRLRVRAPKRRKIANLDPGATSRQAFELRIRRPARGKVTEIELFAQGPGFENRQTVVRLRVRN